MTHLTALPFLWLDMFFVLEDQIESVVRGRVHIQIIVLYMESIIISVMHPVQILVTRRPWEATIRFVVVEKTAVL